MKSRDYLEPYRDAIDQHGPGFRATLWGSEEAQKLRFDVMIDLASLAGCTIVDVGCGNGDFADHLLQRPVAFVRYVGLDALAAQIEEARGRRLDADRVRFEVADVVREPAVVRGFEPDWVCVSGTLNTMETETARAVVGAAFDAANQGVVFNFLSDRHDPRWAKRDLTPAHRFDTVAWLDWAMQRTSRVGFTQDYLDGHDATIVMRR